MENLKINDYSTLTADEKIIYDDERFDWKGLEYNYYDIIVGANGFMEEWHNKEDDFCNSFMIVPGTSLLDQRFLTVMYFLFLCYLFVGISIIADIFMEGIENITAVTIAVSKTNK